MKHSFRQHLKSMQEAEWQKLISLIPKIKTTKRFGVIHFEESQGPNQEESPALPTIKPASIVEEYSRLIKELKLISFLDDWDEGYELLNDAETDFKQLDLYKLCLFFSLIERTSRFEEGYLIECFETGKILKIITAIKEKVSLQKGISSENSSGQPGYLT
jgi:hypothetical protein